MLDKIFTVGNRKIVAFLIGTALTLFGDKLGITMTEDVQQAIMTLVGIFTAGNVASKFAYTLGNKSSVNLTTDVHPSAPMQAEEASDLESRINNTWNYAKQIAGDATKELNNVHGRCKAIEEHMAKQSNTINQLLSMINNQVLPAIKGAPGPGPVMPQGRVPTPNELYNQE